jgi:hypothetical protein
MWMDGLKEDVALIDGASYKPPSKTVGKSLETAVAGDRDEEKEGEDEGDEGGEEKW